VRGSGERKRKRGTSKLFHPRDVDFCKLRIYHQTYNSPACYFYIQALLYEESKKVKRGNLQGRTRKKAGTVLPATRACVSIMARRVLSDCALNCPLRSSASIGGCWGIPGSRGAAEVELYGGRRGEVKGGGGLRGERRRGRRRGRGGRKVTLGKRSKACFGPHLKRHVAGLFAGGLGGCKGGVWGRGEGRKCCKGGEGEGGRALTGRTRPSSRPRSKQV
jgi:hypothetical protein